MIEGLKFDFPVENLRARIMARVEHHTKRAEFYDEEAARYGSQPDFDGASNNRSALSIRDKGQNHRGMACKLTILAETLVQNETYRLSEHDLRAIDLIS